MKGQIATPALMKSVLDLSHGLRTGRVICQIVLMEIRRDDRRFLMADTGITVEPSLDEKADILHSAVDVAHALGVAPARRARGRHRNCQGGHAGNRGCAELTRRNEQGRARLLPDRGAAFV